MKHFLKMHVRKNFMKMMLMMLLSLSILSLSARGGIDSYAIYLNDKLLVRQSLDKPLDLKMLPLTAANKSDNLVIEYMQCNAPSKVGKNRAITIRDAEGRIIKEWKFKDSDGSNTTMVIPVSEILVLQNQAHGSLSFYYSADGLHKVQKLAALQRVKKLNTAKKTTS
jgi:hypothetical protein